MKRRRFCKSDLMIAATLIINILVINSAIAASSQPASSFYLSQKILHQLPNETPTSSALFTTGNHQTNSEPVNYNRNEQDLTSSVVSSSSNISDDEPSESLDSEHDESVENYQETPDQRNMLLDHHNSQLQAMHDLFERRQLNNHQLQSSQELNPIAIGLDPVSGAGSPYSLPPFQVPNHDGSQVPHNKPSMASADNLDQGLGPSLPFGLNPLPHLLGFQNSQFDGPQRGDQSAHSNHHAVMPTSDPEVGAGGGAVSSQKVWPKIFRFTDGRINLSDFEKQKKIRLSSKNQHNTENHIESAPIMFDGRQLKRKSFLILHGGIFSR